MVPSSLQLSQSLVASVVAEPKKLGAKVSAFRSFLEEYHLMHLLPEIQRHISHQGTLEGRARGLHLTTALPLDETARRKLLSALGSSVDDIVSEQVDETLIGGCTIAQNGVLYDVSLKNALERLRLALLQ